MKYFSIENFKILTRQELDFLQSLDLKFNQDYMNRILENFFFELIEEASNGKHSKNYSLRNIKELFNEFSITYDMIFNNPKTIPEEAFIRNESLTYLLRDISPVYFSEFKSLKFYENLFPDVETDLSRKNREKFDDLLAHCYHHFVVLSLTDIFATRYIKLEENISYIYNKEGEKPSICYFIKKVVKFSTFQVELYFPDTNEVKISFLVYLKDFELSEFRKLRNNYDIKVAEKKLEIAKKKTA